MMKSSELIIIVESVEEAVKFYTEKLAFDLVDLEVSKESSNTLTAAYLRKGKCFVTFRVPHVEELAEFSFIKRCASRCIGLRLDMKKRIEKYFQRCQKKGLKIVNELREADGYKSFSIRDPFGNKLTFAQPIEGEEARPSSEVLGMPIDLRGSKESDVVDKIVNHLRSYGVLRRPAKKYAKLRIKQLTSKK